MSSLPPRIRPHLPPPPSRLNTYMLDVLLRVGVDRDQARVQAAQSAHDLGQGHRHDVQEVDLRTGSGGSQLTDTSPPARGPAKFEAPTDRRRTVLPRRHPGTGSRPSSRPRDQMSAVGNGWQVSTFRPRASGAHRKATALTMGTADREKVIYAHRKVPRSRRRRGAARAWRARKRP